MLAMNNQKIKFKKYTIYNSMNIRNTGGKTEQICDKSSP